MVIKILTFNYPEKFRQLLSTIDTSNPHLHKIIVIDNSNNRSAADEIRHALNEIDNVEKLYVGKQEWKEIRKDLIEKMELSLSYRKLLKSYNLGESFWNSGGARNVSQVVTRLFVRKSEGKILNLDDDILLPADFPYEIFDASTDELLGFKFSGSPDFSNLNWIYFYQRYLSEKYDIEVSKLHNKIDEQFEHLSLENAEKLIHNYSNIEIEHCDNIEKVSLEMISREEVSGGAYVEAQNLAQNYLFPNVYNEDWIWASHVRTHAPIFAEVSVIHNASKRDIFDSEKLYREEYGEVYEHLFSVGTSNKINDVLDTRSSTYELINTNFKILLSSIESPLVKANLKSLYETTDSVSEIHQTLQRYEIRQKIGTHTIKCYLWTRLAKELEINSSVDERKYETWNYNRNFSTL